MNFQLNCSLEKVDPMLQVFLELVRKVFQFKVTVREIVLIVAVHKPENLLIIFLNSEEFSMMS